MFRSQFVLKSFGLKPKPVCFKMSRQTPKLTVPVKAWCGERCQCGFDGVVELGRGETLELTGVEGL